MKKGDRINTPRFCIVVISEVLTQDEAREKGYSETTHYCDREYDIRGKSIRINRMKFAAIKKC